MRDLRILVQESAQYFNHIVNMLRSEFLTRNEIIFLAMCVVEIEIYFFF